MQKWLLPLIFSFLFIVPSYSQLQGDMYEARQGYLATKDSLPGEELYSILGLMDQQNPFIFDFNTGKCDAWLYVYRSVTDTTIYSLYAVVKLDSIWTVYPIAFGLDMPAGIRPLKNVSWIGSDSMMAHLNRNQVFKAYRDINKQVDSVQFALMFVTSSMTDSIPPQFLNKYAWLMNLNNQIQCIVDAITGESSCELVPTSVSDKFNKDNLVLYPNPANDIIYLSIDEITLPTTIGLFDIFGNKLSEFQSSGGNKLTIPVNELPVGTYIIRMMYGGKNITQKFSIIR